MIRHKRTGRVMVWYPTEDGLNGLRLCPFGESSIESAVAFWYLPPADSSVWPACSGRVSLGARSTPADVLLAATELGVVEVSEEDPPKDYDAIHRDEEESDRRLAEESDWLLEDVRALAIRLFLAGHDDAASALRRLL